MRFPSFKKLVGWFNNAPVSIRRYIRASLIFILILFIGDLAVSQTLIDSSMPVGNMERRPRNKESYDKPGHYEMVAYFDKSEISPGDSVNVNVYFSGYGSIGLSKVYFSFSRNNIFEKGASYYLGGLSRTKDSIYFWGAHSEKFDQLTSTVVPIGGLGNRNLTEWRLPTNYIDLDKDPFDIAIITEFTLHGNAPYSFHLKTTKNAQSGTYPFTIVYTYFNGQEWQGGQQNINLKINNIIERNPGWSWAIGIGVFLLAFIGIIPILLEAGKRLTKKILPQPKVNQLPTPPQPQIRNKKKTNSP